MNERGAALIEYAMVLAFVAVLVIIGGRAIGGATANLFAIDDPSASTQVLGATVERPFTRTLGIRFECHAVDHHNIPPC